MCMKLDCKDRGKSHLEMSAMVCTEQLKQKSQTIHVISGFPGSVKNMLPSSFLATECKVPRRGLSGNTSDLCHTGGKAPPKLMWVCNTASCSGLASYFFVSMQVFFQRMIRHSSSTLLPIQTHLLLVTWLSTQPLWEAFENLLHP